MPFLLDGSGCPGQRVLPGAGLHGAAAGHGGRGQGGPQHTPAKCAGTH